MAPERFQIGVISSSQSLIDCVRRVAAKQDDHIEIAHVIGLNEAIPVGREMEKQGVEVVISRRGAAAMLRENLSIPVLSLPVSSLNILQSLQQAKAYGRRILLPVFRSEIQGLEVMEEILQVEIIQDIYYDSASLRRVVRRGAEQGLDAVIGGGSTQQFAHAYGIRFCEIADFDETVAAAIENARSVARSRRQEQEKTEFYRCIINATSDGVIVLDEAGRVNTMNQAARTLLNFNDDDAGAFDYRRIMSQAEFDLLMESGRPLEDRVVAINHTQVLASHLPVTVGRQTVGVVSTFRNISQVMRAEHEVRRSLTKGLTAKYRLEDIIHRSPPMQEVIRKAKRFANSDSTLLLTGETGTGKEILAQSIHVLSPRRQGPFVSINCAALPEQLLESELFGYEEGAFTGSRKGGKPGLFELAHKGTIFLDEIGATPQSVQLRLLRVLQEREVMRVGGDRLIPVNVRVIAAANKNLAQAVQSGHLREDLYFRLHVLHIHIPPLRERMEDLPVLTEELIRRISTRYGIAPLIIPPQFVRLLLNYSWPGNVRQLENFLERLVLLSDSRFDPQIFDEIYQELIDYPSTPSPLGQQSVAGGDGLIAKTTADLEAHLIEQALIQARYNKTKAAQLLGISRTTLWRKLRRVRAATASSVKSAK